VMEAAEIIMDLADSGPIAKKYRFASQFESAAISIPANIDVGHAGATTKVYVNHLYIARGSLAETQTYLELAARRKYVPRPVVKTLWNKLNSIGRMLHALLKSLESKPAKRGRSATTIRRKSRNP